LKLRPNDSSGKLALGAAFVRAKDFDLAVPWLKEALQSPETSVTAQYYLGRVAREQRNLNEAISLLQQVLSSKRDYPDALAELGQCYLLMKDYPRAEQYFNQALKSNPDHYTANFNLLTLYKRTGDSRSAAQQARFDELQARLEEKSQEFRRVIEVRPLDNP
jgi:tetratricopeptide (TPR) repeat protein